MFLSHNWSIKDKVNILDDKLKAIGLKTWRDVKDLENNEKALTGQLASALKKSKMILCCITIEYCKSIHCNWK